MRDEALPRPPPRPLRASAFCDYSTYSRRGSAVDARRRPQTKGRLSLKQGGRRSDDKYPSWKTVLYPQEMLSPGLLTSRNFWYFIDYRRLDCLKSYARDAQHSLSNVVVTDTLHNSGHRRGGHETYSTLKKLKAQRGKYN